MNNVKQSSERTNKLIDNAVKNHQSDDEDYIIDYFAELIFSVKTELGVAQATNAKSTIKNAIKNEIKIRSNCMTALDSAVVFARRIIYFNLVLSLKTAWRLP
ncbi:hypothetical protein [Gilliamella sp. Nev3-1]|uniref:hypothetical protein n=1 Tax=Gilliamella sp. Nev3-1 TaxID=3120250 RepID=UPI00080E491B|nr:hypothetical protein [Gilliamella apicola]OCG56972.1 hypothetical protein A9G40_00725 [Gilliamella apicola]